MKSRRATNTAVRDVCFDHCNRRRNATSCIDLPQAGHAARQYLASFCNNRVYFVVMIPSHLFVRVQSFFFVMRHSLSAACRRFFCAHVGMFGFKKAMASGHAYSACMGMLRTRRQARSDSVCFPAALLALSFLCAGATPLLVRTIHKQSTMSSMLMHPVLLFCMQTADKKAPHLYSLFTCASGPKSL